MLLALPPSFEPAGVSDKYPWHGATFGHWNPHLHHAINVDRHLDGVAMVGQRRILRGWLKPITDVRVC